MLDETKNKVVLEANDLSQYFYGFKGLLNREPSSVTKAVDQISFKLYKGETLGLVGESGCGKSTLARTIMGVYKPTQGQILFEGQDLAKFNQHQMRQQYCKMQMIFQDPYSSINPKKKIYKVLEEPFVIHNMYSKQERREKVEQLIKLVGLDSAFLSRYPHEFSGGQRQRIGIARALALNPGFIICDEAVSALDVSIQAQIINLLKELQQQFSLSYLFISHNLAVVKHISNRIAVMYLGQIVELSDKEALYDRPGHPYTRALISAATAPDPTVEKERQRTILPGEPPSPKDPPAGCRFHPRCQWAQAKCREQQPPLLPMGDDKHLVACHFAGEI